ncbi:polyprenyl synthetase family protein [Actinomyces minihominis]|uniref:polyprenyl synthetase family protein n=1 Tax=Actinomyces minihominis TaxID=2002838 RepID=UPI000C08CB4E|nr:polyprenyl synthetase family protein [Actinomyces minihominis]
MSVTTDSPISAVLEQLRSDIDERVEESAEAFFRDVVISAAGSAYEPAISAVSGGKRFRAVCALIGAAAATSVSHLEYADSVHLLESVGSDPRVQALTTALELYQASALVHDDLLDGADTRRGQKTPHVYFAELHSRENLWGSATNFGRDGAVLTGDLLLSAAFNALAGALPYSTTNQGLELSRRFSLMTGEVALGQWADTGISYLPLSANEDGLQILDTATLMEVVRQKSARYSIMHPAVLGAVAVGAGEDVLEILARTLEPAGVAFQLRDDALGAFSEEAEIGKPTATDIVEGKRTVLLALTLQNAPLSVAQRLIELYGQSELSPDEVEEVRGALRNFGNEAHEQLISELTTQALGVLEAAALPDSAKDLVRYLIRTVTNRSS